MSSKLKQLQDTLRAILFSPGEINKQQNSHNRVQELIENHPCFSELSLWRTIKADSLLITDLSKKEMTKEYLYIVCTTCEDRIKTFKQMDLDKMRSGMTGNTVSMVISSILAEINKKAAADGIPYMFLEKMDTVISRHIEIMADSTTNLQLYREWSSAEDKVLATLDMLYITIRIIGDDIPNIVNSMNGELKAVLEGSKFDRY